MKIFPLLDNEWRGGLGEIDIVNDFCLFFRDR